MDLFIQSIVVCIVFVNLTATALLIYKVFKIEDMQEGFGRDFHVEARFLQESFGSSEDKIDGIAYETTKSLAKLNEVIEKIDKVAIDSLESISALMESPEITKPKKPNNWDGVKAVFSRPSRVDVNERN
jgi:hypothetical protein